MATSFHEYRFSGSINSDGFTFRGTYSLPVGASIDPTMFPTTVSLGNSQELSVTVPSSLFVRMADRYEFIGNSNGITKIVLRDDGQFEVEANGVDLTAVNASSNNLLRVAIGSVFLGGVVEESGNIAPFAYFGEDRTVVLGGTVPLDGSFSRDLGNRGASSLSYNWTLVSRPEGSSAELSSIDGPTSSFVGDVAGQFVVQLVVNDGELNSEPALVTVTVPGDEPPPPPPPQNTPPVAVLSAPSTGRVGDFLVLDGSGSTDAEGNSLTYSFSVVEAPVGSNSFPFDNGILGQKWFVPDLEGVYKIRLVVNDGQVDSGPVDAVINVGPANRAPIADPGMSRTVRTLEVVQLDGSQSTDPDGDQITFSWQIDFRPDGSTAELTGANTATPTFVPDQPGTYFIRLDISDGSLSSSEFVEIDVAPSFGARETSDFC